MLLMSITSNKPIVTCFDSYFLEIKLITTMNVTFLTFTNRVAHKQLNNFDCTYIIMVFSTKLCKTFSTKIFFDGKIIHGHNFAWQHLKPNGLDNFHRNPLTTSNNKFSKSPPYVGSSFLHSLSHLDIVDGYTCALFLWPFQSSGAFVGVMLGSSTNFFIRTKWSSSTCFFMVLIPLILHYVISPFIHLMCMARIFKPI